MDSFISGTEELFAKSDSSFVMKFVWLFSVKMDKLSKIFYNYDINSYNILFQCDYFSTRINRVLLQIHVIPIDRSLICLNQIYFSSYRGSCFFSYEKDSLIRPWNVHYRNPHQSQWRQRRNRLWNRAWNGPIYTVPEITDSYRCISHNRPSWSVNDHCIIDTISIG